MFWDEPVAREKYDNHQPFQVFSCWGGMVTLDVRPFMDGEIIFRRSDEGSVTVANPRPGLAISLP